MADDEFASVSGTCAVRVCAWASDGYASSVGVLLGTGIGVRVCVCRVGGAERVRDGDSVRRRWAVVATSEIESSVASNANALDVCMRAA